MTDRDHGTPEEAGLQSVFLPISFSHMRLVPQAMLAERLQTVKELAEDANEAYRLVKDAETGEHYLHYVFRHLNVAAGGAEEAYHQLIPLEHDDVIALALGAEAYAYPQHWKRAYLRNGPNGGFVWYDPEGATEEAAAQYEQAAEAVRAKLAEFRSQGRSGEEEVRRLMEEVDRLFKDKE